MPCALRQTHLDNQKVPEAGHANWSKDSLQLSGSRRSSEVCEISSFNLRNNDQRCAILTFPTLESDGQWRIFALPLQGFDHSNHFRSGNQVNMNDLHLVSAPSINSFMVDGRKTQKGTQPASTYPAKPFRGRSFSGSNVQNKFGNKIFANKITKFNEVSNNSSYHGSINCNDSSAVTSKGFNAINRLAMFVDCSEEDKFKMRDSQRWTKRKGKHKKKQLCDVGSTGSEVYSQYTRGNSASEIYDSSNGAVTCSGSPIISTSDIDEVDTSESIIPSQLQKFPGEHHINNAEFVSEQQLCRGRGVSHMGSVEGLHQKDFCDMHDSLVLDSVFVGSNSEDSRSAVHIVKPINDNIHRISQSELPGSNTKKEFYHQKSICSAIETHDYMEESKRGLARSILSGRMVASGKRGKQFKSIPGSSSTCKPTNMGNLHCRAGTENGHSVWKRVQRNAVEKCDTELKITSPICSEFDVSLKDAPVPKRNPNAANVTAIFITDEKRKSKSRGHRKLKSKVGPASKQENNSFFREESHPNKVNLNFHENTGKPKSDILNVSNSLDDHGLTENLSRSCSQVECPRVGTMKFESVNYFQAGQRSREPCDTVCGIASGLNNLCIESQDSILQTSFVPLDQPNLREVQSPVYLPHLMVNGVARTEKGISLAENGKQSHNLGSVMQKWIPIRIKDYGLKTSARSDNLSLEHTNGPDAEDWTSKNALEDKVIPCSENLSPFVKSGTLCRVGKDSRYGISSLENGNHIQNLRDLNICVNGNENKHSEPDFLIDESKEQNLSAVASDLNKIAKALNDAYRAQMASEAVQMATGCPIAEFERLLHFCSPVICHSDSSVGCQTCLPDHVPRGLLHRHETPNITLGSLWQWYEKHGSYGLEVRAEDHNNPKRLGIDQFAFRAYFVPYLSAVQLFRDGKSNSTQNNSRISSPGVSEASDTDSTSRNSATVGHPPIFSVLVPHLRTSGPTSPLQVNDLLRSEPSEVSPEDVLPVKSVDITPSDCIELAFEYFETEQPQRRRALYEKIQDLVRDDVSPQCKIYGDPVCLNSINIHDLHPRSWYSVAWYPIYKIPDGTFRAAFLTYHSLGHLVHRSSNFDYPSMDACIVSPVVGLLSYNAQGECWFQPRHSTTNDTCEEQGLSTSGILKERLRTLEETASLMARAVVTKGNKTSVNRHPDYEFFSSRQQ